MTSLSKTLLIAIAALSLSLTACEKEGPAERAGEKIDEATENVKDAVEDAGDEIEEAADNVNK